MRFPISFIYGNCVFARDLRDCWAAFRVEHHPYSWCSQQEKHSRLLALVGALEALEADVQILRVHRSWDLDAYARSGVASCDHAGSHALHEYLERQAGELARRELAQPVSFVIVSLREPQRDLASWLSQALGRAPGEWRALLREGLRGLAGRGLLPLAELERARLRAELAHARLAEFLPVQPARALELQWLVRRAFCRGAGEPQIEALHEPRALVFESNGEAVLAPLEGDVLRWANSFIDHGGRLLRVESEGGESWQAQLVLGALPERVDFPGDRAELMLAVPESLDFGIDLSLNARFLPNELALRIARRRVQDADQILNAEAGGEQGASDLGLARTQEARELLSYLQESSRPPLLRATLAVAVGARDPQELERRVEACRRAFGEVRLHRPLGDQLELFMQHLPGQRTRVAGYDDTLTTEQVGAMMPFGGHEVGSRRGFYLGYTLTRSRQPVRFNLREGSDSDRNTTILCVGALGSGKTTLAQKLKLEGFLQGARVVDCDPKGDHRFHLLDEVAPHAESLTLKPDPALRGVLDPLRVAPAHLRQEATISLLRDLLPARAEPSWETALVAAVDRVMRRSPDPTCGEVVAALADGDEVDRRVGTALGVYARSGLTQLCFAQAGIAQPPLGRRAVTYLPIRDLPAPEPGVRRSDYTQAERVGQQIVRLIAMFALRLMGSERDRLKLFSFDEGWRLLGDPVGRALLTSLQRMGRSELAVPIIGTQLVTDTLLGEHESIDNLLGATFVFGMRSESEAARALALMGLDPEDRRMLRALLSFDAGRCLFRDHRGRVEAVQVDLVVSALMRSLSTTPRAAAA